MAVNGRLLGGGSKSLGNGLETHGWIEPLIDFMYRSVPLTKNQPRQTATMGKLFMNTGMLRGLSARAITALCLLAATPAYAQFPGGGGNPILDAYSLMNCSPGMPVADAIRVCTPLISNDNLGHRQTGYMGRADAYFRNKQYAEAAADYSELIATMPTAWVYYYNRGAAYANMGQLENALADMERAAEGDPSKTNWAQSRDRLRTQLSQQAAAIAPSTGATTQGQDDPPDGTAPDGSRPRNNGLAGITEAPEPPGVSLKRYRDARMSPDRAPDTNRANEATHCLKTYWTENFIEHGVVYNSCTRPVRIIWCTEGAGQECEAGVGSITTLEPNTGVSYGDKDHPGGRWAACTGRIIPIVQNGLWVSHSCE